MINIFVCRQEVGLSSLVCFGTEYVFNAKSTVKQLFAIRYFIVVDISYC